MSDYTLTVKRILGEAGCYFDRAGKGDHEIWFSIQPQDRDKVRG